MGETIDELEEDNERLHELALGWEEHTETLWEEQLSELRRWSAARREEQSNERTARFSLMAELEDMRRMTVELWRAASANATLDPGIQRRIAQMAWRVNCGQRNDELADRTGAARPSRIWSLGAAAWRRMEDGGAS